MTVPFEELMQTFDLYSSQSSDGISKSTVPLVLRSCRMFCTHSEMEDRLQKLPADPIGRKAFEEFVHMALKPEDFCTENDLAMAFRAFATRDEASLSNDEIFAILTRMKDSIGVDEARGVLNGFDINTEDTVDIDSLARYIMRPVKEYKLTAAQVLSEVGKSCS